MMAICAMESLRTVGGMSRRSQQVQVRDDGECVALAKGGWVGQHCGMGWSSLV
jgi:hypothetical protein